MGAERSEAPSGDSRRPAWSSPRLTGAPGCLPRPTIGGMSGSKGFRACLIGAGTRRAGGRKRDGTESRAISPKVAATNIAMTAVFLLPADRTAPGRLEPLSPIVIPLDWPVPLPASAFSGVQL
jgi:hypothetical protein